MIKLVLSTAIIIALSLSPSRAQQKEDDGYTLEKILDAPRIRPLRIEESSFTESWYLLSLIMSEDIASKDSVAGALQIASQLRFLSSTDREGKKPMPMESASVRSILQSFANLWKVLILVDGNTVYIVDEGDEKRFRHNVTIRRQVDSPK